MVKPSLPIHLFSTHREAEHAVRTLASAGCNVRYLSLVGTGIESEEHPARLYSVAEKIRAGGGRGAFWGGVWGLLVAPTVFFLPGLGPVAVAGPLASSMVGAMENTLGDRFASALGAALIETGAGRNAILQCESALKIGNYVLIVHVSAPETKQVNGLLAARRSTARESPTWFAPLAAAERLNGDQVAAVS